MSRLVWQPDSFSSHSLLELRPYFVLTGQILRVSGNKHAAVILGAREAVSQLRAHMDRLITFSFNLSHFGVHLFSISANKVAK